MGGGKLPPAFTHAAASDDQVWLVQINQRVGAYGILVKLVAKIIRF